MVDKPEVRNEVEVDEARPHVGEGAEVLDLDTVAANDELWEELGESFVENVTGADDAATEHRTEEPTEDDGGPPVKALDAEEGPGPTPPGPPEAAVTPSK
jgi:hypothetical protein